MKKLWKISYLILTLAALLAGAHGAVGEGARRVGGHVPAKRIGQATHLGRHDRKANVPLSLTLTPRDAAGLADLIRGLHDPADSRYGQFLSADEFRARFAPTDEDVALVANSLRARGLKVKSVAGNNLLLNLEGSSAAVEEAFQLELHDFRAADGRVVFAPSAEPLLVGAAAERVMAVNGLSTFSRRHTHTQGGHRIEGKALSAHASVSDYMTPTKVRTAYGLTSFTQTGTGETLALFELDGYTASDINTFASRFGQSVPTLQNVYVGDGSTTPTGAAGSGADEVTLDIELAMAVAPGLSKIMVYEGANSDTGVLNTYARIASDNLAKEVSTSWGEPEDGPTSSFLSSENTIFQQMAAQGQSMFAASGDNGAYDDISNRATTLVVDDPGSQPYVTSVGGTTLNANATTGAYISESSWGDTTTSPHSGGGGGISQKWAQPSWQSGLATSANRGSSSNRMVPDLSLNANPTSGYPIYVTIPGSAAAWYAYGGTSAAAPALAAMTAVLNQARVAIGQTRIGFFNPTLYAAAKSSSYASMFHDIADSSTNLYYPAVSGYDLSTGWGSPNAVGMFAVLVSQAAPSTPTGLTGVVQ